jgi:hypothetical protein
MLDLRNREPAPYFHRSSKAGNSRRYRTSPWPAGHVGRKTDPINELFDRKKGDFVSRDTCWGYFRSNAAGSRNVIWGISCRQSTLANRRHLGQLIPNPVAGLPTKVVNNRGRYHPPTVGAGTWPGALQFCLGRSCLYFLLS